MARLTDPSGAKRDIKSNSISMIYYARGLSPEGANSTVLLGPMTRAFAETGEQVAEIISADVALIKLNLPRGPYADAGPAWFNVSTIAEVKAAGPVASILLDGRRGYIRVVESKRQVDEAIAAAAPALAPVA